MRKLQYRRRNAGERKEAPWQEVEMPDIDFDDLLDNMEVSWDFIAKFYRNYSSSGDVAYSNDLQCYIDGEKTLEELNKRGCCIKSVEHAEEEMGDTDRYLMRLALNGFYREVLDGEIEFNVH